MKFQPSLNIFWVCLLIQGNHMKYYSRKMCSHHLSVFTVWFLSQSAFIHKCTSSVCLSICPSHADNGGV